MITVAIGSPFCLALNVLWRKWSFGCVFASPTNRELTWSECGGAVKVIACIEDRLVIYKILAYTDKKAASVETGLLPEIGAPPQAGLFD